MRKTMNRNCTNQKPNPALKTKMGNITSRQKTMGTDGQPGSYFPKGGHSATQTELKV